MRRGTAGAVAAVGVAVAVLLLVFGREDGTCAYLASVDGLSTTRLRPCSHEPWWVVAAAAAVVAATVVTVLFVLVRRDVLAVVVGGWTATAALALGVGAAFVALWAPPPGPENASPPPEPFLFAGGALLGLVVGAAVTTVATIRLGARGWISAWRRPTPSLPPRLRPRKLRQ